MFKPILLICFWKLGAGVMAWGNPFRRSKLGGRHLISAGESLQAAADCVDADYFACPSLLKEAGTSMSEVGEAWAIDNWEAVTYAAEDCSSSFQALSQLQSRPVLQKVYKGASGELNSVACSRTPDVAAPSLAALGTFLNEAADVAKQLNECKDTPIFCQSLRKASKSIRMLAKEVS
jgi:hypothetical protein